MDTLLGILFIIFCVGLVKPKLVLRWDKNPTRLKVFLYWFFISMFLSFIIGNNEMEEKSIIEDTNVEETVEAEYQKKRNRVNNIKSDKKFNLQEFENKYGIQMFDEDITEMTVIKAQIASRYYFKESVEINKEDIEIFLKEKLKVLDSRRGFKHFKNASHVLIWLYPTRNHAKEKGVKWIGMIDKMGEDAKVNLLFDDKRHNYFITPTTEVIYGIEEEKRQEIFRAIIFIEDKALKDAKTKFPNPNDWEKHYDYQAKRDKKYKKKLLKHYDIEDDIYYSIISEGISKGWLEETGQISFKS